MIFNPVRHIFEMMGAQGVGVHLLQIPYENANLFDDRLRQQLYKAYDYSPTIEYLVENCHPSTVYLATDSFESRYALFQIPQEVIKKSSLLIIGPYLVNEYNAIIDDVVQKNNLSLFQQSELKEYYRGVPIIKDHDIMEATIVILAKYVFDSDDYVVDRASILFSNPSSEPEIKDPHIDSLSLNLIEERYHNEDILLRAIEQGNIKQAITHLSVFRKYHLEPRVLDSFRNAKNYLIIVNTLYRKTVQRAAVHPAYIDELSSSFGRRIEAVRTTPDLNKLMEEMVYKYCLLVQNHSLRSFSSPIQKAMRFIHFNYTEQIKVEDLASVAELSSGYLSMLFKKEVGTTIIEYINQKRVQYAQLLLTTTDISIQRIAGMAGFLDDNYFSRIFRKHRGSSPRNFRKSFFDNRGSF